MRATESWSPGWCSQNLSCQLNELVYEAQQPDWHVICLVPQTLSQDGPYAGLAGRIAGTVLC